MTASQTVGLMAFLLFIGVLAWLSRPRRAPDPEDHPPTCRCEICGDWGPR